MGCSLVPDFWTSTDSGKVCFAAVASDEHCLSTGGQYHKEVGGSWCHFPDKMSAPGNAGGFHGCCVDTLQPGSEWVLVAKLADFGLALGRDAGLRTEFIALIRSREKMHGEVVRAETWHGSSNKGISNRSNRI